MSEYQNRAVALMTARLGAKSASDPKERNEAYLAAAIELFFALGGSKEDLVTAANSSAAKPAPPVDAAIGELMKELAAIGPIHDLDIMQAAHNTLDLEMQSIRTPLDNSRKVR